MIRGKALEDISLGDYVDCILDEKTGFLMVRKARPESTEREKVCDEIIESINKFYVESKSTYSFVSALLDKIKNIRNKASF